MSSTGYAPAAPQLAGLEGSQRPRICWVPPYASTVGAEAIEVCELAGLQLDDWQQWVLINALGESPDWKCSQCTHRTAHRIKCPRHPDDGLIHPWMAFEVGANVARQNGKGGILEGRELVGLFLLEERLIIHSAHLFDTSLEAFRRLLELIENCPDLDREVKRVSRSHGEEGIELKNGSRIRFKTRTKGGGRGLSGDCVILDEAMILPEATLGALMPTLSARPNPQLWYTGSAVDQEIHEHGRVFTGVRNRGIAGGDPRLMYAEWSADGRLDRLEDVIDDPDAWAAGNPALGIRVSHEFVATERRAMAGRTFAVERLGIGDYPNLGELNGQIINIDTWRALADQDSEGDGSPWLAFDINPQRTAGAIGAAGRRADGLGHLEVRHGDGIDWIVPDLVNLARETRAAVIVVDGKSPAASLVGKLEKALADARLKVEVREVNAQEHADACGMFYDAVDQAALRHVDLVELTDAIKGASRRPLSGAWAWDRVRAEVDISPLVAVTLAWWAAETIEPPKRTPLVAFR